MPRIWFDVLPNFCLMKISQGVRDFAAQQGVDEVTALQKGMEQKVVEFVKPKGPASLFLPRRKANGTLLPGFQRHHEFTDDIKNSFELDVISRRFQVPSAKSAA